MTGHYSTLVSHHWVHRLELSNLHHTCPWTNGSLPEALRKIKKLGDLISRDSLTATMFAVSFNVSPPTLPQTQHSTAHLQIPTGLHRCSASLKPTCRPPPHTIAGHLGSWSHHPQGLHRTVRQPSGPSDSVRGPPLSHIISNTCGVSILHFKTFYGVQLVS